MQIAIDGPVGSGKSTLARLLAKELEYIHIDTGNMYRALGVFVEDTGRDVENEREVIEALQELKLEVKFIDGKQETYIDGINVTNRLISNEAGMLASKVSSYLDVRKDMVRRQQNMSKNGNVVLDGRDIGTVVLPKADFKFYVDATPEIRAKRRFKQLEEEGLTPDFDELLSDVNKRDYDDMNREHSPLSQAEDAIIVKTDDLNIEEVLEVMISEINK